ncbi:hypothetical protein WJX74_007619 [Apatococcus lobatus]|uniref:Uncharacterized protein n=1 Tax=Apatococcus lobatus TaxID=904363 RepID=A0AAW1RTU3_9CHLO
MARLGVLSRLVLVALNFSANALLVAAATCKGQDYDTGSYVCPYLGDIPGNGYALCPASSPCARPDSSDVGYGCFASAISGSVCG